MRGEPVILRSTIVNGYQVELHERADTLGFLSETFWVAPSLDGSPFNDGTGRTAVDAIAAMLGKQPATRLAA